MGARDEEYGTEGPAESQEAGETLQMDPSEVAELHRQLAAIGAPPAARPAPRSAPAQPPRAAAFAEAETMAPDDDPFGDEPLEEEAPAPPPRAAAKAQAPKAPPAPAKPAPVRPVATAPAAPTASGAQIAGGIGGLLLAIGLILMFPPILQELPREEGLMYGLVGGIALGYALLAVGLSSVSRLTNALGGVAAVLAYLTVLGYIAQLFVLRELRGDTRQLAEVIIFFLPWATWLFIGLWGLSSSRAIGAVGVLGGAFGLLAGSAGVGLGIMRLARIGDRDVFEALAYGAAGAVMLAALLVAIALLSGVREGT